MICGVTGKLLFGRGGGWHRTENALAADVLLPVRDRKVWPGQSAGLITVIGSFAGPPEVQLRVPGAYDTWGPGRHGFRRMSATARGRPRWSVVGIIETVRNRLLDFVLKIEAEAPAAGEAEPGQIPLPQEMVTQIFNNHIYGGVAHIGGKRSHGGSNTLHIGTMHDSQIQQSGDGSNQTGTFSREVQERSDLEKLVHTLSERMDELNLDESARKKAEAQVATIQAQLADDDPDPVIIAQAGKTLRNVTEGVIGGLIATAIQPGVWQWVAHFMATHFTK